MTTATPEAVKQQCEQFRATYAGLQEEVGKVIVGHRDVIDGVLTGLFVGGNILLEGVPGLGKTLLVRTLADTLSLAFSRIQFTPDLMPSDITGTNIVMEDPGTGHRKFEFSKGPVFANIVLADEINRATPKSQSAMLEAMQEHSVTIGGVQHKLPSPFLVMATQNPIEQEGTYPLPEAQLDRFMFSIEVDYPSEAEEVEIVERTTGELGPEPEAVIDRPTLLQLQALVRNHLDHDDVPRFAVALARATRPGPNAPEVVNRYVQWGAGPRASQFLLLGARVRSALHGRPNATLDDVRAVATSVLQHRIVPSFAAEAEGLRSSEIVRQVLATMPRS